MTNIRVLSAAALTLTMIALSGVAPSSREAASNWRTDPAWYQGKAEWAVYAASRPLEGGMRTYEATIYTNKQQMDPATTTKAADWRASENVEVFKHNLSEYIPCESYAFRFLTTAFVRTDTMKVFKLAASTQEDCGSTYKQFVVSENAVDANAFSYHVDQSPRQTSYDPPRDLAFHDALSLTLRDYPFDADDKPTQDLNLVPDQTLPWETGQEPRTASVSYVGRETIDVPYGAVDVHHLRVEHAPDGRSTTSDYWFAAADDMRHVMVKYEGPYDITYELKRLDWWAYWSDPKPE